MSWFLTRFPSLQPLEARYRSLSPRERILVGLLALVVSGFILVNWILMPASAMRTESIQALTATQNAVDWMRNNQAEAQRRAGVSPKSPSESGLSVISQSANLHNLTIRRMQPREEVIDVELLEQDANSVFRWITVLEEEHGIQLINARIDRYGVGIVNCRLSFL